MKTVLLLALAFLIFAGWVRLMENRLTFYPIRDLVADPSAVGTDFRDISAEASDGVTLHGWYCLPPASRHRADILFLHGNGGNVSHRLGKLKALTDMGLGILILDYRGYGRSGGKPSDKGILRDAEAGLAELLRLAEVAGRPWGLFGESIGCLLAVRLAETASPDFLILEGAFPGKREVAASTVLFWPFAPVLSNELSMGERPSRVRCPVLVMHAKEDEVIPVALGREVHRRFGPGAVFHELRYGGHNDSFVADPDFFPVIGEFVDGALDGPREQGRR